MDELIRLAHEMSDMEDLQEIVQECTELEDKCFKEDTPANDVACQHACVDMLRDYRDHVVNILDCTMRASKAEHSAYIELLSLAQEFARMDDLRDKVQRCLDTKDSLEFYDRMVTLIMSYGEQVLEMVDCVLRIGGQTDGKI